MRRGTPSYCSGSSVKGCPSFSQKYAQMNVRTQVRPLLGIETTSASPPLSWPARLLRFHLTTRFMAIRSVFRSACAMLVEAGRVQGRGVVVVARREGKTPDERMALSKSRAFDNVQSHPASKGRERWLTSNRRSEC